MEKEPVAKHAHWTMGVMYAYFSSFYSIYLNILYILPFRRWHTQLRGAPNERANYPDTRQQTMTKQMMMKKKMKEETNVCVVLACQLHFMIYTK